MPQSGSAIVAQGALVDGTATFIPALVALGYLVIALLVYLVRLRRRGPLGPEEALGKPHTSRLAPLWLVNFVLWSLMPFERLFMALRFSPNALTFASLCFAAGAAVALGLGYFGAGGWLFLTVGAFDLFDGRIARKTGRVSVSGAFYDSVVDRYAEGLIFAGLVVYYRSSWVLYIVLLALVGSYMVSYTRARGESLGVRADFGSMQRPERIVALSFGLALSPVVASLVEPNATAKLYHLAVVALSFVALSATVTALHRFAHIFIGLRRQDPPEAATSSEAPPQEPRPPATANGAPSPSRSTKPKSAPRPPATA